MHLNETGSIVERQWNWLKEQYPYLILHSFQVMPNHAHGIIEISRDLIEKNRAQYADYLPDTKGDHNLFLNNLNQ